MALFEFTIFGQHERQTIIDEELHSTIIDDTWFRFKTCINLSEINITCFRQYVLFDNDNNPTNCLKIYLNDGSILLSPHSFDKFKEMYLGMYKNNGKVEE